MSNIKIVPLDVHADHFDAVVKLYCSTFTADNSDDIRARFQKHAGYAGFRGYVAVSEINKNVIGFAYGYTSLPGQYYNTKLKEALTSKQSDEWLDDCFEFVELAVDREYRRHGVATHLHQHLLSSLPHRTSVLTTRTDNTGAQTLYDRLGWQVIQDPFYPNEESFVMMGKRLK